MTRLVDRGSLYLCTPRCTQFTPRLGTPLSNIIPIPEANTYALECPPPFPSRTHGEFHQAHHAPTPTTKPANDCLKQGRQKHDSSKHVLTRHAPPQIAFNAHNSSSATAPPRRSNRPGILPKGQKGHREPQPQLNGLGRVNPKKTTGGTRRRPDSSGSSSDNSNAARQSSIPPAPAEDAKLWDARRRDSRVNGADLYVASTLR